MLTPPPRPIRRFYQEVWNETNEAAAREMLHPEFRFHSSLGPEKQGADDFSE